MAFTPRAAKRARVRYNGVAVTSKKWSVNPEVSSEADVTSFEGSTLTGPDGTAIIVNQKLATELRNSGTITLDADAAANLYDAGIKPGNSSLELRLYLNDTAGPYWSFPTPFFKSVPMEADVKQALGHTIQFEGSGSFVYPTGAF